MAGREAAVLNYIKAELWKALRHRIFWGTTIFLVLCTALFGFLMHSADYVELVGGVSVTMLTGMLVVPLLVQVVDGGRGETMKNEISFGLSRGGIYGGKLLSGLLLGLGLCAVLLVGLLGICAPLLPHGDPEAETVAFPNCPVMESIRPLSPQTLCGTAVILGALAAAVDTAVCALAQGARRAVVVCPSANVRQKFVREQMELAKEHGIEILTDVVPVETVPGGLLLHGRAGIQMTLPCDSIWSALPDQSVIAAVAAGRRDAVELDRRLRGDNAVLEPTPAAIPVSADKVLARTGYYRDQMQEPVLNTLEDAVAEASRCLNCGCGEGCQLCKTICTDFAPYVSDTDEMAIDRSQCVACGMCFNRCPNGNIEMCSTGRKI